MKLIRKPLAAIVSFAAIMAAGCGPTAAPYVLPAYQTPMPMVGVMSTAQADAKVDAGETQSRRPIDFIIVRGQITKLLPDDLKGLRHQHFLVAVSPQKTVKVAHNIDLAPYVPVKVGDLVEMKCEYIKAQPYDVAHWTHWNPRGGEGGYIRHQGKTYDKIPGSTGNRR